MTQLPVEVNNISSKIMLFLNTKKIKVVSATMYQMGKKLLEPKDIANDFCQLEKDASVYGDAYKFLSTYCANEYRKQQEAVANYEQIPDYGFYGSSRARMRSRQLYFCDSPASPGYILTPDERGDYHVSDDMHSLHVFRRDLGVLGEEAYAEWTHKNLIVGAYRYEPWGPTLSENTSNVYTLNIYKKPKWENRIQKKRSWEELPPELRCFYRHLFPDEWQMHYALNWLSCSVQIHRCGRGKTKLSTYLALIGASGVGKGIFLEKHGSYLHGFKNFVTETKQHIGEKFALSAYYDKTLLVFNETEITTRNDYNAIKSFESEMLNVELKNQTPRMQRTYFSTAWSMNPTSGLKYVDPDDRRFSIPDINREPIKGISMKDKETGEQITFDDAMLERLSYDDEVLVAMAEYLLGIEPDFKLAETPLKLTSRYKEVMQASRPAWVQELLEGLQDIDWESPGGSVDQLGYREIRPSNDKDEYYTYEIETSKVMRMVQKHTTTRRSLLPSKNKVMEELKRLSKSEVHAFMMNGFWAGLRIRHPDHDRVKELMRDKFVPVQF